MDNIKMFDDLVSDMDIPDKRKHDWGWLRRNIGILKVEYVCKDTSRFNAGTMMLSLRYFTMMM